MELVLGIDLGTSFFKTAVFSRDGSMVGLSREPVPVSSRGGRHELPAPTFHGVLKKGIHDALAKAGAEPECVRAISYSSQANSFLLLDDRYCPLTPIVLWPDSRAESLPEAVERLSEEACFGDITGIGIAISPLFVPAKTTWFRKEQPETWQKHSRIMTIPDFLVFSLTGEAKGDAGTASLTGLWNVQEHHWWDKALDAAGIPESSLSQMLFPGECAGRVSPEAAKEFGLPSGIPVAAGSLDHHVAATGAGAGRLADFSESTGTVLACLRLLETFDCRSQCCTGPGLYGNGFYQLAFDENSANVLQWYRETHAINMEFDELARLAADVPSGCDGLTALPCANRYEGLEGFPGACDRFGHGHFTRAIMESCAATLDRIVTQLCGTCRPDRIVATGGGARSDLWLQIKAETIRAVFTRTSCEEPACMGAALLASVVAGWHRDINEASEHWIREEESFSPSG